MAKLVDNVKMTVTGTGTGAITVGSAGLGYQSFVDAGVTNGEQVVYGIVDGANWEHGVLTYNTSNNSFTRAVSKSSNSDSPINVTSNAVVFGAARVEDIATAAQGAKADTASQPGHAHAVADITGLQSELNSKAPLASPALTGNPTAPTQASGNNTTRIATTAFVADAVSALVDTSPAALDTLNELAAALGDDPNFATTMTNSLSTKLVKTANLSDLSNKSTARSNLGVAIGSDVQAYDANLPTFPAGITTTEIDYLNGLTGNIQTQLDAKGIGDVTSVTAGTGLSGGGTSGALTLNVDLSELTDMTAGMLGTDEFIVLDNGNDRRKAANEIPLSIFNNDAGFTSNTGNIATISTGAGLTGGGSSGTVSISHGNTSSQASVNNSGLTVIQDVTVDTYGHVTFLGSKSLALTDFGLTATNVELNHTDGVTSNIQTQLNGKAGLASPAFTGNPTAPTQASGNNTTRLATTAFVTSAISTLVDGAPGAVDTLNELAAALGDDPNFAATMTANLSTKLVKSSNLSDLSSASIARDNLGVAIGSDVQAYDANLPAFPTGISTTEVGYLNGLSANIQTQLDGKAATSHTHTIANVTGLQTALDGKLAVDGNSNLSLTEEVQAKCYLGTVVALSGTTPTLDCSTGNDFSLTTSGNTTITLDFSNVQLTTNESWTGSLTVTAGGTHTLAFAGGTRKYNEGTQPDAPANGETDVYVIHTTDGATFTILRAGDAVA